MPQWTPKTSQDQPIVQSQSGDVLVIRRVVGDQRQIVDEGTNALIRSATGTVSPCWSNPPRSLPNCSAQAASKSRIETSFSRSAIRERSHAGLGCLWASVQR